MDSWKRTKELFGRALALPEGLRQAYLALECAGDEKLRCEVEELLVRLGDDPGFLEHSRRA